MGSFKMMFWWLVRAGTFWEVGSVPSSGASRERWFFQEHLSQQTAPFCIFYIASSLGNSPLCPICSSLSVLLRGNGETDESQETEKPENAGF